MNVSRSLTIGDVAQIFDGPHATPIRMDSGPYFLNIASLASGRLSLEQSDHVSEDDYQRWTKRVIPEPGDLLFSYETRLGEAALMPPGIRACLGRRMALLRFDRLRVVPRYFLYYYLSPTFQQMIESRTIHGATVPRIALSTMSDWNIHLPHTHEQQAIADVLGALDDKIVANNTALVTVQSLCASLFEAAASEGACDVTVDEIALFLNRRRVPLSASQREAMPGRIPYYGATGVFGRIAEYIFDAVLVLVGEDGSVVNDDGTPVMQYIWGPSWVNNHAHVLQGRRVSNEILYLALRRQDVRPLVTGAVQAKISMGKLKSLLVKLPNSKQLTQLDRAIQPLFSLRRTLTDESRTLATLRDTLLPALMSGKLRVRDAERQVEEVV